LDHVRELLALRSPYIRGLDLFFLFFHSCLSAITTITTTNTTNTKHFPDPPLAS